MKTGLAMARGSTWIFLAEVLIIPTGFVTAVYLTRALGPADYGVFALLSRLVIWLEWLGAACFAQATIKLAGEMAAWTPLGRTALRLHLAVGAGLAMLLWAAAPALAAALALPSLTGHLRLYALDLPLFLAAQAHINILVGRGGFGARAMASAARLIVRLAAILLFVHLGWSVRGAVAAMICASAAELAVVRRHIQLPLGPGPSHSMRALAHLSVPLLLASLVVRVLRLDIVLLKALGTPAAAVGHYGAALNLTILMALLSGAMTPPLLATLSGLIASGRPTDARAVTDGALRFTLRLIPFVALACAQAGPIVRLVFGAAYLPAAPLLALLLVAAYAQHLIQTAVAVMAAHNRSTAAAVLTVPLLPVAIAAHLFLIPRFGPMGAAATTTAMMAAGAVLCLAGARRCCSWPLLGRTLVRSLPVAAGVAFLSLSLPTAGAALVAELAGLSALCLLGLWWLGELSAADLAAVRRLLARRFPSGRG